MKKYFLLLSITVCFFNQAFAEDSSNINPKIYKVENGLRGCLNNAPKWSDFLMFSFKYNNN